MSLSPGEKRLGSESDHSLIMNGGYECVELCLHFPYPFVRDNFICFFQLSFFLS